MKTTVLHDKEFGDDDDKTTMMLIEKLMEEGKSSFELATTAAATHNWAAVPHVAEYLYGRLLVHFDRHLLGVAAPKL